MFGIICVRATKLKSNSKNSSFNPEEHAACHDFDEHSNEVIKLRFMDFISKYNNGFEIKAKCLDTQEGISLCNKFHELFPRVEIVGYYPESEL